MKLGFVKMHGTGNDFILIDNRDGTSQLSDQQIQQLCARHTGIGSDGLILIEEHAEADFFVNFYNPDASQSFCGNGSRCAIAFAAKLGVWKDRATFAAIDGLHEARFCTNGNVRISMSSVHSVEKHGDDHFLNTGSPHLIRSVSKVAQVDVKQEGAAIRYSSKWKSEGVNVNFVEQLAANRISIRTYERGVEDETLSCGTGVTAAALSHAQDRKHLQRVFVETLGGKLEVSFQREGGGFKDVFLSGPTQTVFQGSIDL